MIKINDRELVCLRRRMRTMRSIKALVTASSTHWSLDGHQSKISLLSLLVHTTLTDARCFSRSLTIITVTSRTSHVDRCPLFLSVVDNYYWHFSYIPRWPMPVVSLGHWQLLLSLLVHPTLTDARCFSRSLTIITVTSRTSHVDRCPLFLSVVDNYYCHFSYIPRWPMPVVSLGRWQLLLSLLVHPTLTDARCFSRSLTIITVTSRTSHVDRCPLFLSVVDNYYCHFSYIPRWPMPVVSLGHWQLLLSLLVHPTLTDARCFSRSLTIVTVTSRTSHVDRCPLFLSVIDNYYCHFSYIPRWPMPVVSLGHWQLLLSLLVHPTLTDARCFSRSLTIRFYNWLMINMFDAHWIEAKCLDLREIDQRC